MTASAPDAQRFHALNKIVSTGLKTFLKVGQALAEIREKDLFRVKYETWEAYLEKEHGVGRAYACRLIRANAITSEIEAALPIGNVSLVPQNESQVRPLANLESSEERAEAWQRSVDAAGGSQPSAKVVASQVASLLPQLGTTVSNPNAEAPQALQAPADPIRKANARETAPARLHDGSELPDSLWVDGRVPAISAQKKLDEIAQWTFQNPEETTSLQTCFIDVVTRLNALCEEHPSPEMRRAIIRLLKIPFGQIATLIPLPGEWEEPPRTGMNQKNAGFQRLAN